MRKALIVLGVFLSLVGTARADQQSGGLNQVGPLSRYAASDLSSRPASEPATDARTTLNRNATPVATLRRPGALAGLYVSLAGLNALDVYSTTRALNSGAREVNPVMATTNGNFAAGLAIKAATTTSSIYLTEKLWKKNRAAAIGTMLAVNGVTAAIVARNFRNAR